MISDITRTDLLLWTHSLYESMHVVTQVQCIDNLPDNKIVQLFKAEHENRSGKH